MPHPRERHEILGQGRAEATFAAAHASERIPHAWLLGGPQGIGKATLSYRFARFLLAPPGERVGSPSDPLAVTPAGRTARQVAAGSHPNLMVLERPPPTEKGSHRTIAVEAVRRALSFFGTTAADGGHRVCIVDSLEDLNPYGANALLKTIEEPPLRATILLVSHAPKRALATIRSRCRKLSLEPLGPGDVVRVLERLGHVDSDAIARAAAVAEGSIARALMLLDPRRLALVEEIDGILQALPDLDIRRVLKAADRMADRQGEDFALGLDRVQAWAGTRLEARAGEGAGRLAALAEACEKIDQGTRELEAYNLDRRAFVIGTFGALSEALRHTGQAASRSDLRSAAVRRETHGQ